jgi:hypothetical protein
VLPSLQVEAQADMVATFDPFPTNLPDLQVQEEDLQAILN